jgi:hypothetical protein
MVWAMHRRTTAKGEEAALVRTRLDTCMTRWEHRPVAGAGARARAPAVTGASPARHHGCNIFGRTESLRQVKLRSLLYAQHIIGCLLKASTETQESYLKITVTHLIGRGNHHDMRGQAAQAYGRYAYFERVKDQLVPRLPDAPAAGAEVVGHDYQLKGLLRPDAVDNAMPHLREAARLQALDALVFALHNVAAPAHHAAIMAAASHLEVTLSDLWFFGTVTLWRDGQCCTICGDVT